MYQYSRNTPQVYIDPDGQEIRFANAESARHGLSDAKAGLPPSQRAALTTVTAGGKTTLKVNGDDAKAAGPNSLLGRLAAESASSKVVQVTYVKPTDTITVVGNSGAKENTSLEAQTTELNKRNPSSDPNDKQYVDGLTLFAHGDKSVPAHSADAGTTDSYVSDEAVDSPGTFYEEVVVHAGTFVTTDDPTA
jgi:hypothetical protein